MVYALMVDVPQTVLWGVPKLQRFSRRYPYSKGLISDDITRSNSLPRLQHPLKVVLPAQYHEYKFEPIQQDHLCHAYWMPQYVLTRWVMPYTGKLGFLRPNAVVPQGKLVVPVT